MKIVPDAPTTAKLQALAKFYGVTPTKTMTMLIEDAFEKAAAAASELDGLLPEPLKERYADIIKLSKPEFDLGDRYTLLRTMINPSTAPDYV